MAPLVFRAPTCLDVGLAASCAGGRRPHHTPHSCAHTQFRMQFPHTPFKFENQIVGIATFSDFVMAWSGFVDRVF